MLSSRALFIVCTAIPDVARPATIDGHSAPQFGACTATTLFEPSCGVIGPGSGAFEQIFRGGTRCCHCNCSLRVCSAFQFTRGSRPPSSRWCGGQPSHSVSDLAWSSLHGSCGDNSSRTSDRGGLCGCTPRSGRRSRLGRGGSAGAAERAAGGAAAQRDSHPRPLPRRRAFLPSTAATARPPGRATSCAV